MYSHQIEDMAKLVVDALAVDDENRVTVTNQMKAAIASYWSDQIAVTWTVEDVQSKASGLTDEQAMDVLHAVLHDHDAERGISWHTIRSEIEHQFGDVLKDDEENEDDEDDEDEHHNVDLGEAGA